MKIISLEVFGPEPPCPRCIETMQNAVNAASKLYKETGVVANVNKLDIRSGEVIGKYGILMSPAVAVNGVVKVMGRIPTERQVLEILKSTTS